MRGGCPEGKMTCGEPYSEEDVAAMDLSRSVSPLG
jgi:hypothetical protein